MGIPVAICPRCKTQHRGWALMNPRHQTCSRCGGGLEVSVGGRIFEGYSPFQAGELDVKPGDTSRKQEKLS